MNVQLLLLLALAGPFCAFTHASPTEIPTELQTKTTEETTEEDSQVITGPTPTLPVMALVESTAEVLPEESTIAIRVTEVSVLMTEAVTTAEPLTSGAPVQETTAPTEETVAEEQTVASTVQLVQVVVTESPEVPPEVTAAAEVQPEVTAAAEVQPEVTEAPEVQPELTVATNAELGQDQDVVLENGTDGELSSGQVVGIVIGALLAVVIVIAVVIAVVRRMGKYSSVRNKKPVKKDSVMISPLKKKSAKQHENPKFWKF